MPQITREQFDRDIENIRNGNNLQCQIRDLVQHILYYHNTQPEDRKESFRLLSTTNDYKNMDLYEFGFLVCRSVSMIGLNKNQYRDADKISNMQKYFLQKFQEHSHYNQMPARILGDLLISSSDSRDMSFVRSLRSDPHYKDIDVFILDGTLQQAVRNRDLFSELMQHHQYINLEPERLGSILEAAALSSHDNEDIFYAIEQHPNYELIPPSELSSIADDCLYSHRKNDFFVNIITHPQYKNVPEQDRANSMMKFLEDKVSDKDRAYEGCHEYKTMNENIINHRDYKNISPENLTKLLNLSLKNKGKFFADLIEHEKYPQTSLRELSGENWSLKELAKNAHPSHLADKIVKAIESNNKEDLQHLFNDNLYNRIHAGDLSRMLKAAIEKKDMALLDHLSKHDNYSKILSSSEIPSYHRSWGYDLLDVIDASIYKQGFGFDLVMQRLDLTNIKKDHVLSKAVAASVLLGNDAVFDRLKQHPNYQLIKTNRQWDDFGKILESSIKNQGFRFAELKEHPSYKNVTNMISLIEASIENQGRLFDELKQHHGFKSIEEEYFYMLIEKSIKHNGVLFDELRTHDNYAYMRKENMQRCLKTAIWYRDPNGSDDSVWVKFLPKKQSISPERYDHIINTLNTDIKYHRETFSNLLQKVIKDKNLEEFNVMKEHYNYSKLYGYELLNVLKVSIESDGFGFENLKMHNNYGRIEHNYLCYFIQKSIEDNNGIRFREVFEVLKEHPNYKNIERGDLCDLIKTSISNGGVGFEELIQHPKYKELKRSDLVRFRNDVMEKLNSAQEPNYERYDRIINTLNTDIKYHRETFSDLLQNVIRDKNLEEFNVMKEHYNYSKLYGYELFNVLKVSIESDGFGFGVLKDHPNYRNIDKDALCDLIKTSINNRGCGFEELIQHPKFRDLLRVQVAHLIEASMQAGLSQERHEYITDILSNHEAIVNLPPEHRLYIQHIKDSLSNGHNNVGQSVYDNKHGASAMLRYNPPGENGNILDFDRFNLFTKAFAEHVQNTDINAQDVNKIFSPCGLAVAAYMQFHDITIHGKSVAQNLLDIMNKFNQVNNHLIHNKYQEYKEKRVGNEYFDFMLDKIEEYANKPAINERDGAEKKNIKDQFEYLKLSIDHFDLSQKVERSLEGRNASVADKLKLMQKEVEKEQSAMMKEAKKEALQPKGYKDDMNLKAAIANLAQNINPQNAQQQQQQLDNTRVRSKSANLRG